MKDYGETIELLLKRVNELEKKLEKYYKLLCLENELDFILKGKYVLDSELEKLLNGNY